MIRTNITKGKTYIDEIHGPTRFIELNDFDYTNFDNINVMDGTIIIIIIK